MASAAAAPLAITGPEPVTTNAIAAHDTTGVLSKVEILRRPVGVDDVAVDIKYCGICHSDLHQIRGEWDQDVFYPMVPGHEIVGIVSAIGSRVTKFKKGDRVGVGCLVDSCRKCPECKQGLEQYCEDGQATYNCCVEGDDVKLPNYGKKELLHGGYSNYIVVSERFVVSVPDSIPLEKGGPLLCAGITTYSPLVHHGAKAGNLAVGVIGFGGLGHMAVKLAKAMGNQVFAISRSVRKKASVEALGATFINSTDAEDTKQYFHKLDLVINTVSANHDVASYFDMITTGGTMVLVGVPPDPVKIKAFAIITRRINFSGSLIGGLKETQEMLNFCAAKGIVPETQLIKAADVNGALYTLSKNAAPTQRFVIDIANSLGEDTVIADEKRIDHHEWKVNAVVEPADKNVHATASKTMQRNAVLAVALGGILAAAIYFGLKK